MGGGGSRPPLSEFSESAPAVYAFLRARGEVVILLLGLTKTVWKRAERLIKVPM